MRTERPACHWWHLQTDPNMSSPLLISSTTDKHARTPRPQARAAAPGRVLLCQRRPERPARRAHQVRTTTIVLSNTCGFTLRVWYTVKQKPHVSHPPHPHCAPRLARTGRSWRRAARARARCWRSARSRCWTRSCGPSSRRTPPTSSPPRCVRACTCACACACVCVCPPCRRVLLARAWMEGRRQTSPDPSISPRLANHPNTTPHVHSGLRPAQAGIPDVEGGAGGAGGQGGGGHQDRRARADQVGPHPRHPRDAAGRAAPGLPGGCVRWAWGLPWLVLSRKACILKI